MMFPVGFDLAVDATRRQARSALPDAPVIRPDSGPRQEVGGRARTRLRVVAATALRTVAARAAHAAERVEPCGYDVAVRSSSH